MSCDASLSRPNQQSMSAPPAPATPPSPTGYLPPLYSRLDITPRRRRRSSGASSSSAGESSSAASSDSWTSSRHAHEDQLQWDESIRTLELLFSVVALPFVAKWAGKKFAVWRASPSLCTPPSRS